MSRNPRENLIVGGFICIAFGAFFTVGGVYSMGATVGVSGIIVFIIGMSMKSDLGMSEEAIQELIWASENAVEESIQSLAYYLLSSLYYVNEV